VDNFMMALIASIFTSNVLLTQFLGICPVMGVSKSWNRVYGLSLTAVIVMVPSLILAYTLETLIIVPLEITYLSFLIHGVMVVVLMNLLENLLRTFAKKLFVFVQPFFPLLYLNSLVIGAILSLIQNELSFVAMLGYALGAPIGFAMIFIAFSAIRERILLHNRVPRSFQGSAIALLILAFIAMAMMAFTGLV
jgi:electron transport complex protein RnfA